MEYVKLVLKVVKSVMQLILVYQVNVEMDLAM